MNDLYKEKIQRLFNEYFNYLKSNGGLGNAKGYEELYKWEIVTKCKGKPDLNADDFVSEIVAWAKAMNNLLYVGMQPTALRHLAEYHPSELKLAINSLYDETVPLNKRVATYINTCDNCWDEEMKKAFGDNTKACADERLASDFLTCHNPQKYTFYKNSVYKSLCDYFGIATKGSKEKLAHFYELINTICLPTYSEQKELKNLIDNEAVSAGYEVNDLLAIQTALYLLSENQLNINNDNKISTDMGTSKYDKYIKLLKANHNIVLTGAPGTGKTFMAKEIAKEMGAEVGFVQFHPSYDYTDFVEGLRPISSDGNGNIGFERKDGVFKQFCKHALRNYKTYSNFDEVYQKYIDELLEQEEIELKTLVMHRPFKIGANSNHNITIHAMKTQMVVTQEMLRTYVEEGIVSDWKPYTTSIAEDLREKHPELNVGEIKLDINKPYVFIIDEINRGEISKIFGELFFSIDPGYRGEIGRVKTQYQNLITDKTDTFYEGFYVPDNVYIIGTMNDIDRRVESMDFAMRRRFTWVEVTAEDSMDNMGIEGDKRETMTRLNNAIRDTEGLGKDYELGGAYFLGDIPKEERWEYKIEGLLHEYLRGVSNADEKMKKLEAAYYGTEHNDSDAD